MKDLSPFSQIISIAGNHVSHGPPFEQEEQSDVTKKLIFDGPTCMKCKPTKNTLRVFLRIRPKTELETLWRDANCLHTVNTTELQMVAPVRPKLSKTRQVCATWRIASKDSSLLIFSIPSLSPDIVSPCWNTSEMVRAQKYFFFSNKDTPIYTNTRKV